MHIIDMFLKVQLPYLKDIPSNITYATTYNKANSSTTHTR
jgi:hypothetical protein